MRFFIFFFGFFSCAFCSTLPKNYIDVGDAELICHEMAKNEMETLQLLNNVESEDFDSIKLRNFASATVQLCYIDRKENSLHEVRVGSVLVAAPYRKFISQNCNIPENIFLSSERKDFLERFEGLSETEGLKDFVLSYLDFKKWKDEIRKSSSSIDTQIQNEFNVGNPPIKFIFGEDEGGTSHVDDAEQQIVDVLKDDYENCLNILMQKFKNEHESMFLEPENCDLIIRCIVYTKMDPCPFCLSRLDRYFKEDFLSQNAKVINEYYIDFPPGAYMVPLVSSRKFYEYKRNYSTREILFWHQKIDPSNFYIYDCRRLLGDDYGLKEDLKDIFSNYHLILYAIPNITSQTWTSVSAQKAINDKKSGKKRNKQKSASASTLSQEVKADI